MKRSIKKQIWLNRDEKKNQQFNWHGDFVFQSEDDAKRNNIPDLEKYFLSEKVKKYVLSCGCKYCYNGIK